MKFRFARSSSPFAGLSSRTGLAGIASLAVTGVLAAGLAYASSKPAYEGSRFAEVWGEVVSNPYAELPQERVSVKRFFAWTTNRLKDAADRTLSDESDLLPRFDKLVHPNGICLKGTWNITEPSPYTGYFESGRRGLIIARASVALSDTEKGRYRGFGLAGKIFPTENPNHTEPLRTANFFVIDDLGGTLTEHYADAAMTNEPKLSVRPSSLGIGPIGAAAGAAFALADRNPQRRQVYPIAELGLSEGNSARTPKYMMVRGAPGSRFDVADFRDELAVSVAVGPIEFDVLASEDGKQWSPLGFIEFTDAVASDSCDHRLHFAHPKFRRDLP